jgi:hypothetical protein
MSDPSRSGASDFPEIPAMPLISLGGSDYTKLRILAGPGWKWCLGWQHRSQESTFVLARRTIMDDIKIVERFPLTQEGWQRAWRALASVGGDAVAQALTSLAEYGKEMAGRPPSAQAARDMAFQRLHQAIAVLRERGSLAQETTDDQEVKRPGGQFRLAGWLWIGCCLLVLAVLLAFGTAVGQPLGHIPFLGIFLPSFVFSLCALAFNKLGLLAYIQAKRHFAPSASDTQLWDPRPPVLYLRDFSVDDLLADNASHPFRTDEEQIARACRRIGPFLAIGKPGERLPRVGAVKAYLPDSGWQQAVVELIKGAGFVLVGAGMTASLMWEVEQVVDLAPPERIMVLIPFDEDAYEVFRVFAEEYFGRTLPAWEDGKRRRKFGIRAVIFFEADWTPCLVRLDTGDYATLEKGLRLVLES